MVVLVYYFFRIYYLMQHYHHYEFQQNKRAIVVFMVCKTVTNLLNISELLLVSKLPDPWEISNITAACFQHVELFKYLSNKYLNMFLTIPYFQKQLICVAVIMFKKNDDILQGINKLDYLLKASVFQKYKNYDMERNKNAGYVSATMKKNLVSMSKMDTDTENSDSSEEVMPDLNISYDSIAEYHKSTIANSVFEDN